VTQATQTLKAVSNVLGFSKTYELPLAKGYVRHWGMAEAVRELLQNALDSESPFEYEWIDRDDAAGSDLLIRSRYTTLDPSSLLLGATTKAERTDTIGSFGEGYKIALLVLARQGYDVTVYNGERIWTPHFRESRQFGAEVLCISDHPSPQPNEGLTFRVSGLSPDDCAQIISTCLPMQPELGETITTTKGRILLGKPGKLYVGGLFVCDTKMRYGYDVKPEHLRLERDRQTVSTFDLAFITKEFWFESGRHEAVGQMIADNVPDLEYGNYNCPELVKEVCYSIFRKRHPGKIIANSPEEVERYVKQGMTEVVYVGGAMYGAVKESNSYKTEVTIKLKSPYEILADWLKLNRKHMRRDGIIAFRRLIEDAVKWKI